MARPVKNCVDYFPHDAGMRNHKKVKAIRTKFGIAGYGIWCMLLEYLSGNDGNVFHYSDMEFELMSGDFGVSVTEIRDVVDYCIRLEMFFNKKDFINSDSLDERLAPVYAKRNASKELSKQQQRINGSFCSSNTEATVVYAAETPQSKVKEIKVKETKEKKGGAIFKEPTIIEVENEFIKKTEYNWNRNYAVSQAGIFFNHYSSNGWKVGKNKMKNWSAAVSGWIARNNNNQENSNGKSNNGTSKEKPVAGRLTESTIKKFDADTARLSEFIENGGYDIGGEQRVPD